MCWSGPVSLAIGTAGVATALYAHKKGHSPALTVPLVYFSLMEFLQFAGYLYLNSCTQSSNQLITLLSYLHIAFQPIFINMFFMYGLTPQPKAIIRKVIYGISAFFSLLLIVKLIPFDQSALCLPGQSMCGATYCTASGNWHLAWYVPQYLWPLPGDSMLYYTIPVFIVPFFYGAWFSAALGFITGPFLAYFLASGNMNEWPAIWCLYSVLMIIFIFILEVKKIRMIDYLRLR